MTRTLPELRHIGPSSKTSRGLAVARRAPVREPPLHERGGARLQDLADVLGGAGRADADDAADGAAAQQRREAQHALLAHELEVGEREAARAVGVEGGEGLAHLAQIGLADLALWESRGRTHVGGHVA